MKYGDFLKDKEEVITEEVVTTPIELEEAKDSVSILRAGGFKIKLVTPTSFGTEIIFAKQYEKEEIEKALTGFNIKIKGKSVFVVN